MLLLLLLIAYLLSQVKAQGWHLSLLRFLCSVHGVRQELRSDPSSSKLVSLTRVKEYFPPELAVADYWPPQDLLPRPPGPRAVGAWAVPKPPKWLGKLVTIREFPQTGPQAYKMVKASLEEGTTLEAITARPGPGAGLLVTLPDLAKNLGQDVREVRNLLHEQGVRLFGPNSGQAELLERQGKAKEVRMVILLLLLLSCYRCDRCPWSW